MSVRDVEPRTATSTLCDGRSEVMSMKVSLSGEVGAA